MPSTRDIRRRIKSVKNTRQITKAMELVAASKMKKAQQVALAGRPYANLMADVLAALGDQDRGVGSPVPRPAPGEDARDPAHHDRQGPLRAPQRQPLQAGAEIKTPAKFYSIGRKGTQFLARTKRAMVADFQVHDRVPFAEVKVAAEFMVKQYLEGEIDTIEVIYPGSRTRWSRSRSVRPVLPLRSLKDFLDELGKDTGHGARPARRRAARCCSSRASAEVLNALLPFYVNHQIHQLALSAKASEHSARMVAMKTAKDNATELLGRPDARIQQGPPGRHHPGDPRDRRGPVQRGLGRNSFTEPTPFSTQ